MPRYDTHLTPLSSIPDLRDFIEDETLEMMLTSSATDRTLENQNEEEMQSLHGKIKALRSVSRVCRFEGSLMVWSGAVDCAKYQEQ
jgi:DNA-binding transcriptional regulator/RsmH inhibitor MraZ